MYNSDKEDNLRGYDANELRESGVIKFARDEYTEALSFESVFLNKNRTNDPYPNSN